MRHFGRHFFFQLILTSLDQLNGSVVRHIHFEKERPTGVEQIFSNESIKKVFHSRELVTPLDHKIQTNLTKSTQQ